MGITIRAGILTPLLLAGCGTRAGTEAEDTGASLDTAAATDTASDTDTAADTGEPPRARLVVNELMPDNEGAYAGEGGTTPDWIELFNPGAVDVDLHGWSVTDDVDEPTLHVFATSLVVPAGGFVLLLADGAPDAGPTHVGFALGADGDDVALYSPDGWRADWVSFDEMLPDVAAARTVDGDETSGWQYVAVGTPGASNGTVGE